jgi:hypothetical protein
MSTDVTMQELELETAELLPARETLNACYRQPSSSFSVNQIVAGNGNGNGNHDGNGNFGLLNIGNGSLDGNGNGNTVALQVL